MTIIEDHAAIAGELRRIWTERQPKQAEMVVPIGVLRVPTRYVCGLYLSANCSSDLESGPKTSPYVHVYGSDGLRSVST